MTRVTINAQRDRENVKQAREEIRQKATPTNPSKQAGAKTPNMSVIRRGGWGGRR